MRTRSQSRASNSAAQKVGADVVSVKYRKRKRERRLGDANSESPRKASRVSKCTVETCSFLRNRIPSQSGMQENLDFARAESDYGKRASDAVERLIALEPRFGPLVERFGKPDFRLRDVFSSVVQAIVFQQISNHAGKAIWSRFLNLVGTEGSPVSPCTLVRMNVDELRNIGMSRRKGEYVLGVAKAFHDGRLSEREMKNMEDAKVIEKLTMLKGVGTWTAHMILMFSLRRDDVLPVGDLGVRRGATIMFGKDGRMPMEEKEMEETFQRFRGLRSFASYYMWKVVNKDFRVPECANEVEEKP